MIGRREGLDDEEITRTVEGPDAAGWSSADAALVRAVDELLSGWTISDPTWSELAALLDDRQLMDLVFTVGVVRVVGDGVQRVRRRQLRSSLSSTRFFLLQSKVPGFFG